MNSRAALSLVAVGIALALGGCASTSEGTPVPTPPAPNTPTVAPTVTPGSILGGWRLSGGSDDQGAMSLGDAVVTLTVAGADSGGRAPCNSYGLHIAGSAAGPIRVSRELQTEMACADPDRNALETRYLAALGGTTAAELDGRDLVLTGTGVTLQFTPTS